MVLPVYILITWIALNKDVFVQRFHNRLLFRLSHDLQPCRRRRLLLGRNTAAVGRHAAALLLRRPRHASQLEIKSMLAQLTITILHITYYSGNLLQ